MNSFSTDPRDIRKFGLIGVAFFGLLAALALWRDKPLALWVFGALSLGFTSFACFPAAMTPAYRAWMRAAHFVGPIVTAVILTLTYYLVITPYGLLKRLFGGRPLPLERDKRLESYWVERPEPAQPRERFSKRF